MSELRSYTLVEMPAGLAPASNDKPRSVLAYICGALIEQIYPLQKQREPQWSVNRAEALFTAPSRPSSTRR